MACSSAEGVKRGLNRGLRLVSLPANWLVDGGSRPPLRRWTNVQGKEAASLCSELLQPRTDGVRLLGQAR